MDNPHSPTKPWLDGIATGQNGYHHDAEPGDSGRIRTEREGVTYRVEVECIEGGADA